MQRLEVSVDSVGSDEGVFPIDILAVAGEIEDEFVGGLDAGGQLGNRRFNVLARGVAVGKNASDDVAEETFTALS